MHVPEVLLLVTRNIDDHGCQFHGHALCYSSTQIHARITYSLSCGQILSSLLSYYNYYYHYLFIYIQPFCTMLIICNSILWRNLSIELWRMRRNNKCQ